MNDRENQNALLRLMKVAAFALTLLVLGGAGLILPRPSQSVVERRELTAFPEFTLASLWDGSFFSGVDTWYADTYPMRESLIAAQQSLENNYGLRSTQLVGGSGMTVDAIPIPGDDAGADPNASAEANAAPTATAAPTPTPLPDGTVHEIGEFSGSIYITNNCAYGMYGFSQSSTDKYIETMNQIYKNVGDEVHLYVMNVPISASVMLDENVWSHMGSSDEGAAIEYISSKLDPGITPIMVYDTLREHNAEYIYFHTDHHWTALGSYYAYRVFAGLKGWTPHELSEFQSTSFGDNAFLGSYYSASNKSAQLAANPDTVYAWYPLCVSTDPNVRDMYMVQRDGQGFDWRIINDMFDYDSSSWYCVFSGADQPFASMHNPNLHDGSAVMVVKDSYGNAFIPWLVDNYEYTYWVDFRYCDNTVSQMVQDYGVQDVIFEAATFNATGGLCNELFLDIGS